jgi:hypothetical protein
VVFSSGHFGRGGFKERLGEITKDEKHFEGKWIFNNLETQLENCPQRLDLALDKIRTKDRSSRLGVKHSLF